MSTPQNLWIDGEEVLASDLNGMQQRVRELSPLALIALLDDGTNSIRPDANSLEVIAGTGLQVLVGDPSPTPVQSIVALGQWAVKIAQVPLTVPANTSGATRYDYIGIQPTLATANVFTRNVLPPNLGATPIPTSVSNQTDNLIINYYEGNGSAGEQGTYVPAGFIALAQITVPNAATAPGAISYLIPTAAQAIASSLATNNAVVTDISSPNDSILVVNEGDGLWTVEVNPATSGSVPIVGGTLVAVSNGVESLSLAIPSGAANYTVTAEVFAESGSGSTCSVTCNGSSTDGSGTGFNGGTASGGNGSGGGPIYCFKVGTCKQGDSLEISYTGPTPVQLIRITAARIS